LTFAETIAQIRVGECGRSRLPTYNRDKCAAERLHPRVANWCCRPVMQPVDPAPPTTAMHWFRPPADAREFGVSAALRSSRCRKHLDIDGRFQGTADVAGFHRSATQPCGTSAISGDPTCLIEYLFLTSSNSHTRSLANTGDFLVE